MKFIYYVLLGLVAFNAMLVLFAGFFPNVQVNPVDVTVNATFSPYSGLTSWNGIYSVVAAGAGVFGVSLIIGALTKNLALWTGIGAFMSFIVGLWTATTEVMSNITNYPLVHDLYIVVCILIGIVATASVIEMFTGQQGGN